jgi:DNA-binding CsgD family transcriptional regulator
MIDGPLLLSAEDVIVALDKALSIETGPRERVESLLRSLPGLMGRRELFCACPIFGEWENNRPKLVEIFYAGKMPAMDPAEWVSQKTADSALELLSYFWPKAADRPRRPVSLIFPRDFKEEDVRKAEFTKRYAQTGFVETIYTMWAASETCSILLSISRFDGAPYTDHDRDLAMLVTRAIGPVVDAEVLRPRKMLEQLGLSARQYDVLDLLLRGLSEKEIARQLHRSQNTVHTHVMQIYRAAGVSGRAELMASFVDEAIAAAARRPAT